MNARDSGQKFGLSGFQVSGDVTTQWFHPRLKQKTGQENLERLNRFWTLCQPCVFTFTLMSLLKRRPFKGVGRFPLTDNGNVQYHVF